MTLHHGAAGSRPASSFFSMVTRSSTPPLVKNAHGAVRGAQVSHSCAELVNLNVARLKGGSDSQARIELILSLLGGQDGARFPGDSLGELFCLSIVPWSVADAADLRREVKTLQWQTGASASATVVYQLKDDGDTVRGATLAPERLTVSERERLRKLVDWSFRQVEVPPPKTLMGREVHGTLTPDTMTFGVYGGWAPGELWAISQFHRLGQRESSPRFHRAEIELPPEIRELARSLDETAWRVVANDLARVLDMEPAEAQRLLPPLVFIAYRDSGPGPGVAGRLAAFLRSKGWRAWHAPTTIPWSHELMVEIEKGIADADAAVVVFSSDFMAGRTAAEEYRRIVARRERDSSFRAGLLLVSLAHGHAPPELKATVSARVSGPDDDAFDRTATTIYRGLLGLSQDPQLTG